MTSRRLALKIWAAVLESHARHLRGLATQHRGRAVARGGSARDESASGRIRGAESMEEAAAAIRVRVGDIRGADLPAEIVGLVAAVLLRDGPSWVELRRRYPDLDGASILDPAEVVWRILDARPG